MNDWSEVPRVLYVTPDEPDICTAWRVFGPSHELAARGYIVDYCTYGNLNLFELPLDKGRYNIIATPRMAFSSDDSEKEWLQFIDKYRQKNILWFYELDDDLVSDDFIKHEIEIYTSLVIPNNPGRFERICEFQRKSRVRLLNLVDGVTVSTDYLANIVRQTTKAPVYTVPNGINSTQFLYQMQSIERTIPILTIGWSGGPRLASDFEPLFDVWGTLAEMYSDVHFVMQGHCPARMIATLPAGRLHVLDGVPMEKYPATLKNIDIFCCIATNHPFVLAKSPIKFFEASLAGCAVVASKQVYGDVITHEKTGLLASNSLNWVDELSYLIKHEEYRLKMKENAKETVLKQYTLEQTYSDWLTAWSNALHHR